MVGVHLDVIHVLARVVREHAGSQYTDSSNLSTSCAPTPPPHDTTTHSINIAVQVRSEGRHDAAGHGAPFNFDSSLSLLASAEPPLRDLCVGRSFAARSSLLTGRYPLHVNQNNECNDVQSKSGPDLRMTLLPAKMKQAGYTTAMVRNGDVRGTGAVWMCAVG